MIKFEDGVDVTFHFSNLFTLFLALLFFLMLLALSWMFDSFAGARIDVERDAQDLAAVKSMRTDPRQEALRRFDPPSEDKAER